jgi:lysophospholipase L1-like esterase
LRNTLVKRLAVLIGVILFTPLSGAEETEKWEKDIASFEAQDAKNPPPKKAVLFVGSSSIRLWKLNQSFPDLKTINRGFGGSELADSVRYAKRIVIPHEPHTVVLYAGDNDLAGGKSPKQVFADFQQFVEVVHRALPKTNVVYIGIKPSIQRWALIDKVREANRMIREDIARHNNDRLRFVDVEKPMLGADGRPRAELLQEDGLHLNKEGYAVWTKLLRDAIDWN